MLPPQPRVSIRAWEFRIEAANPASAWRVTMRAEENWTAKSATPFHELKSPISKLFR
jgi:hypothetical protein